MGDPFNAPADPSIADIDDVIRTIDRRAAAITSALGLPPAAKYAVLAALGSDAVLDPSLQQERREVIAAAPSTPTVVLEIARGATHVAQFVRSFIAGQAPPAFQLAPAALQLRGDTPAGEVAAGVAGPVRVTVAEDPARNEVVVTVWLQEADAGGATVRIARGREGVEPPPDLIATLELSRDDPEATYRLPQSDVDVLHLEVDPQ